MDNTEVINHIQKYNPNCEHVTLTTIFAQLMTNFNVINFGTPGTGKSYSSRNLLDALQVNNLIIVDNTTTTKGLFQIFLEYPSQNILLDECSAIMRDKAAQDMIKLAMENKAVMWIKNNEVEETEPYKGNIIINTNVPLQNSLIDRCYLNKTVMNKEMTLNFIDYFMNKQDNSSFLKHIKEKIVLMKNKEITLTEDEMNKIIEFLKEELNATDQQLNYSRRALQRTIQFFTATKKLFGCLSQEVFEYTKNICKLYIANEKTPDLLDVLISDQGHDKAELVKKYANETGYTIRHARRLINEKIESGELVLKGRLVYKQDNSDKTDTDNSDKKI